MTTKEQHYCDYIASCVNTGKTPAATFDSFEVRAWRDNPNFNTYSRDAAVPPIDCHLLPSCDTKRHWPDSTGIFTKPALRSYTSAERKEAPVQTIMAEYFPDALMALARHSKKANDKHNPGEPVHWARGKSNDHLNCAGRHILTPDALDPDTGETEAVCLLWRAAAYVQLQEEKRLRAAGIMPLSGVTE